MHQTSDPGLLSVLGGGHVTHAGVLPAATEKKKLPVPKDSGAVGLQAGAAGGQRGPSWRKAALPE